MSSCINNIAIRSMNSLLQNLKIEQNSNDEFIYRGQSDSGWKIVSSFDRVNSLRLNQRKSQFNEHFARFKDSYLKHFPDEMDDENLMSLGQHSGLKTRLIDWSARSFVALFFATLNHKNQNCALYSCNVEMVQKYIDPDQIEIKKYSSNLNKRLTSQSGIMIVNNTDFQSIEDYLHSQNNISETILTKYTISKSIIPDIKEFLDLLGIDNYSLFLDVESIARDTNLKL